MLTGARDGAVASLKIKHVNVELGRVFQDAREVNTKAAKTIWIQFFPVGAVFRDCFSAYVVFLRDEKLLGPEDALLLKARVGVVAGHGFANLGLARTGYANAAKLNTIIRAFFAAWMGNRHGITGFEVCKEGWHVFPAHCRMMFGLGLQLWQKLRILNCGQEIFARPKAIGRCHIQHDFDPLRQSPCGFVFVSPNRRKTRQNLWLANAIIRYPPDFGKGVIAQSVDPLRTML